MRTGLVAAAVLVGAGCAAHEGPVVGPIERDMPGVSIVVENRTAVPLRVLALQHGAETPLGRVDALSAESVRLPFRSGMVRLIARPAVLAATTERRHVSEPVNILEGQQITWELRASPGISDVPRLSTIRVFACSRPGC